MPSAIWEVKNAKSLSLRIIIARLAKWSTASHEARMRDPGESDSDELAARGMQRLPFPKVELLQMRRFLDPGFCGELIAMIAVRPRFSS